MTEIQRYHARMPTKSPCLRDEDLGVLVQDLHELSEFFQKTKPQAQLLPSQQLEDRVASILARSTDDSNDMPRTPFWDVLQIGGALILSPRLTHSNMTLQPFTR
ncbi:hypothetical protein BDR07DRAFT_416692 [Suillus spraguei]|nr:hypothetical protein BDR07DRAFT_416692 [Suillus spraguei]